MRVKLFVFTVRVLVPFYPAPQQCMVHPVSPRPCQHAVRPSPRFGFSVFPSRPAVAAPLHVLAVLQGLRGGLRQVCARAVRRCPPEPLPRRALASPAVSVLILLVKWEAELLFQHVPVILTSAL